jgi:hypothetical protein
MRVLALKVAFLLPGREVHRPVTDRPISAGNPAFAEPKPQADALAAVLKNSPRHNTQ